MPKKNAHIFTGIVAGGGAAAYTARNEPDQVGRFLQLVGGAGPRAVLG